MYNFKDDFEIIVDRWTDDPSKLSVNKDVDKIDLSNVHILNINKDDIRHLTKRSLFYFYFENDFVFDSDRTSQKIRFGNGYLQLYLNNNWSGHYVDGDRTMLLSSCRFIFTVDR